MEEKLVIDVSRLNDGFLSIGDNGTAAFCDDGQFKPI
jgi:hypothetical protein